MLYGETFVSNQQFLRTLLQFFKVYLNSLAVISDMSDLITRRESKEVMTDIVIYISTILCVILQALSLSVVSLARDP